MKTQGTKLFLQGEFFLAEKKLTEEKNYKLLAYMYKHQKRFELALEYYTKIEVVTKRDLIRAGECFYRLKEKELGDICSRISKGNGDIVTHKTFGYGLLVKRRENIMEIIFPLRVGDRKKTLLNVDRKEQDGWYEL